MENDHANSGLDGDDGRSDEIFFLWRSEVFEHGPLAWAGLEML